MLVFLSWSGQRSKKMADEFALWISQVLQAAETWVSTDIEKGVRWNSEINNRLEKTKVGIICLTKENLTSPWILFEAGAIAKKKDAHVCTLLLDVKSTDVEQPLGQFQHTTLEKNDIYQLVKTINDCIGESGERKLPDDVLDRVFETYWDQLEEHLTSIAQNQAGSSEEIRSDREMLEEVVEILRRIEGRVRESDRENLMNTIYLNLLSNAMKYSDFQRRGSDIEIHLPKKPRSESDEDDDPPIIGVPG